jgi:hypothetical protein
VFKVAHYDAFSVMTKTKKSRAEIQRAYRERQMVKNEDEFKEKERKRWYKRRSFKTVKCIEDLTERQKRATRKRWREQKAEYRQRMRTIRRSTETN